MCLAVGQGRVDRQGLSRSTVLGWRGPLARRGCERNCSYREPLQWAPGRQVPGTGTVRLQHDATATAATARSSTWLRFDGEGEERGGEGQVEGQGDRLLYKTLPR